MRPYDLAFLDLQLEFGRRVADLCDISFVDALRRYTNLFIRLGFGRGFEADHPGWRAYCDGLGGSDSEMLAWTHAHYRRDPERHTAPPIVKRFGCFGYGLHDDGARVRLHFTSEDGDGVSPLARAKQGRRTEELAAIFRHVRDHAPQARRVAGSSWLYNVDAYRRLYPPAYVETAAPLPPRFRGMSLWGQFVRHDRSLRHDAVATWRASVDALPHAPDDAQLFACFPRPIQRVSAPIDAFFAFYD